MKLDVPPMRLLLLRQYTCDMCAYVRVQTCFIQGICFPCFARHEYAWNAATYQALKCEWKEAFCCSQKHGCLVYIGR